MRSKGLPHEAVTVPGYTLANGVATDWRCWRAAAFDVVDTRAPGNAPVILGGLCTGGVLAASVALQARERVAGLVLMSPSFNFDGWGLSPVRHLRHIGYLTRLDRYFFVTEREPYGVKNARIREWIARELRERSQSAAGPARVPLRALREAERLAKYVRARLHELSCPILVIHAREDEISSLTSVERFFAALPQVDKELVILENSYHMVTIDNDRQMLPALIDRFCRRLSSETAADHALSNPKRVPQTG